MNALSNPAVFAEIDLNTGAVLGSYTSQSTYVSESEAGRSGLPVWGFSHDGASWGLFRGRSLDVSTFSVEMRSTSYSDFGFNQAIGVAPDGSKAVISSYGPNGHHVSVTDGNGLSRIAYETVVNGVGWGPFVPVRTFVGVGEYAAGAGAVLFSENGNLLPSVVVADAVTLTTCVVTPMSAQGDKNTVFKLICDNLKKLHFSNTVNHALNPVVTAATGIRGAYISFTASPRARSPRSPPSRPLPRQLEPRAASSWRAARS